MKLKLTFRLCCVFIAASIQIYQPLKAKQQSQYADGYELPYSSKTDQIRADYIYLVGGYNSEDVGTEPWGSIVEYENLFIGDKAGDIEIIYTDGKSERVPLIFGYTMWFKHHWAEGGAPFKSSEAEPLMNGHLKEILHLKGAYEGADDPIVRIKVRSKPIKEIKIVDNPDKRGEPLFHTVYLVNDNEHTGVSAIDTDQGYFNQHTIDSKKPNPDYTILNKIKQRLYTFENDFKNVPVFQYPDNYDLAKIEFTGNDFARIMTRVYHDNLQDIIENKMEPSGMLNESSLGAPSWRYDGFGTWVPDANSYVGCLYSRNRSRGILSQLGLVEESLRSVDYLNKLLMYFPENNLTILGKQIPGHWTVIPNKPLEYSTFLTVVANWPTQYTKERFGDDYQNFGNAEPDGHGMSMMDIANVWKNSGSSEKWVLDNWEYINEAVHYIDWAMKNPDVSFNENGLMYGETEGGMMEFTMYNNIPCYLGLRMYTEMAEKAGKSKEASEWKILADDMEKAIIGGFVDNGKWKMDNFGFFHDPSMSFYADYAGYDVASDAPALWYNLCENTYMDDKNEYIGEGFIAPRGLGYDQNIITQTSLLLDKTNHYDQFITALSKLCYSPRLPKPYIVPECASYSKEKNMYRRQGDLGNFVQQNETLRTILLVAGTSRKTGNEVKLMPRLPKDWTVNVTGLKISNSSATINYKVNYPVRNRQILVFTVQNSGDLSTLRFRAGPFTTDSVTVNGEKLPTEPVGDSRWAWVTIDNITDGETYEINIK